MIESMLATLIGVSLLAVGVLFLVFSLRALSSDELSQRLREYVDEQVREPQRLTAALAVRQTELSGSFVARTVLPAFRWFGRILGRLTPTRTLDELGRQLVIAGNPMGLGAREFYGIRLAFMVIGLWLAYSGLRGGINPTNLAISALALYISSYLPRSWLRRMVRARQDKIRKGLADALDMLSVCANAGLGFDQSLQRVSEYWKTPIGVEFGRVVSEMEMGLSRQAALRNMSDRLDLPELSSFVAVVLQSDQLGMSITETLHAQAKQMRIERRFRAQEQARKLPLKMLFPMLFLIFPSLFAVILGPVVPSIAEFFTIVRGGLR